MAHLSEGTLRRKFDDEDALTDSELRHYSACAECQARYNAVADAARAVAKWSRLKSMKTSWATSSASWGSASTRLAMPVTRPYSEAKSASNDSSFDFTAPSRLPASGTDSRLTPTNDQAPAGCPL